MKQPELRTEWKPGFVEVHYLGYMLRKAREAATASNDPVRQVGCVLSLEYSEAVRAYRTVDVVPLMGVGCNTITDESVSVEDKNSHVVHAETAAVLDYKSVTRKEHDTLTAYITRMPCLECAETLRQAGVKTVYFDASDERQSKWYKSFLSAARMMANEGIKLVAVSDTAAGFGLWPIRSHSEFTVMCDEFASVIEICAAGVTIEPLPEAQTHK